MYEDHFQLHQTPFSIAPDPAFLYLSDGHREALAHLTYGFSHGGFVLITGEVGTGKTTLLRNLVKQTPEDLDVAFVLNPRLTVRELLETLCDELGVPYPSGTTLSVKQYIDALNQHLLATHHQGRGTVVIIDEAQNLSPAVLEQIRLLTNLETDKRKLLRIILIGQPELAELLERKELRQLAQRITARYHLKGLSREDTYAYVIHRLARAGGNPHLFTGGALRRLYGISSGIPRVINLVADRALLGAYAEGRPRVTGRLVDRAAAEVLGRDRQLRRWLVVGIGAALATGAASAYLLLPQVDPAVGPAPPERPTTLSPDRATAPANAADRITSRNPDPVLTGEGAPDLSHEVSGNDEPGNGSAEPSAETTLSDADPVRPGAADAPASVPVDVPEDVPEDAATAAPAAGATLMRPDMPTFQSQRLAYEHVFQRWGVELSDWAEAGIPCNFAPTVGLQCLSRTGSWSDLRQLNLPVVLELWDRGAAPFYGAITSADDEQFELYLGDERHRITPHSLRDAWFGSYVVLWRMPPDYVGNLKRGDQHPSVRWLRDQLDSLGIAVPASADAAEFDASLQDAVLQFQRDEQLLADGIVGPSTWIRLGQKVGLPAPALN
ncbi:MAG: AAA family ATPase [Pseudomonadales bacterium]